jgi:hypothetical protein
LRVTSMGKLLPESDLDLDVIGQQLLSIMASKLLGPANLPS